MVQVRDDHILNHGISSRNRGENTDQKGIQKVYLIDPSYQIVIGKPNSERRSKFRG